MKIRTIPTALAAVVLIAAPVTAATTITVANLGTSSLLITDETGLVLSGGSWGVGVFNEALNFTTAEPVSIFSAFNQAGNTALFHPSFPGVIGSLLGPVVEANLPTTQTGPFVGNPMFVLIGNAPTLAGSTEYIVSNSGVNFTAEIEGVGGTISVLLADGEILRGRSTTVSGGVGPTGSQNGQPGITFVPEPSAALLGLLGAVGLLRRRRN